MKIIKPHLKLAILFDQDLEAGGGYHQALNAILELKKNDSEISILIYCLTLKQLNIIESLGFNVKIFHINLFTRLFNWVLLFFGKFIFRNNLSISYYDSVFIRDKIDIIYFTSPSWIAKYINRISFVFTLWDLCHKDEIDFPEVRLDFESRETLYKRILPKATAILVDSVRNKSNVEKYYSIDSNRVYVYPFSPSISIEINPTTCTFEDLKQKYGIEYNYIYYPAQFWAHKNHIYILKGLKILEDKYNIKIGAVFSGGDKGNLSYLKRFSIQLNIQDRIYFVGLVPNYEVPILYRNSTALVMPTYFGPTNLPPLEAFSLGVPVLYSDLIGLKDQVGNAALLLDLDDPESLAQNLKNLISESSLKNLLIGNGYKLFNDNINFDRTVVLHNIIRRFKSRRDTWEK